MKLEIRSAAQSLKYFKYLKYFKWRIIGEIKFMLTKFMLCYDHGKEWLKKHREHSHWQKGHGISKARFLERIF